MSNSNSNIISKNNQVQFSKEVLEYFESIKTDKNKEWIEKYFQILSDPSNITSEKSNIHHIRPCFTFKDNTRTKRKDTQKLADNFDGNKIKLSIHNHIMAHHYLWKIYNNYDSKHALVCMCKTIECDKLSEIDVAHISYIIEEYTNTNHSSDSYKKQNYVRHHQTCFDPIKQEYCSYSNLSYRINKYPTLYKDVILSKCVMFSNLFKYIKQKTYSLSKFKNTDIICFDFIQQEYCTKSTLKSRKQQKSEIYHNIKVSDWVIVNPTNCSKNKTKGEIVKEQINQNNKTCYDFITQSYCKYRVLKDRINNYPNFYKNIIADDWVVSDNFFYKNNGESSNKLHTMWCINNKDNIKLYKLKNKTNNNLLQRKRVERMCFDFIQQEKCTYSSLCYRKKNNKQLYKNIIPSKWILDNNKTKIKHRSFIKCIETNEVHSVTEWFKLNYYINIPKNQQNVIYKNKHFERI